MLSFAALEQFNYSKPNELETIYYLFFEHGISIVEFEQLPLPYIFGILKTYNYVRDEEIKQLKKGKKKY
jgi:hypothetical protein